MRTLKIAYVDFWKTFQPDNFILTKLLKKHFDLSISTDSPDFVICSNFGRDYLKYKCPRIYYSGESVAPDFNVYDYAIDFDNISFGDRYICYPLCLMDEKLLSLTLQKDKNALDSFHSKTGFCSYVVSADGGFGNRRDDLFDYICSYKMIASGGRHKNNLPDGKGVADKLAFQKNYKFCLTCENSSFPGYTTEKIIDAFAAGSIPIYWGDPNIKLYFNEKAFINCLDYSSDEELLNRIKEIDNNDALYLEMLSEPAIHSDSLLIPMMEDAYLEDFILPIFNQNPADALRRNSAFTRNGKFHEHDLFRLNRIDDNAIVKKAKAIKRHFWGGKKL